MIVFVLFYILYNRLSRARSLVASENRPALFRNGCAMFSSSITDEKKISLKRDVPSYPKVKKH